MVQAQDLHQENASKGHMLKNGLRLRVDLTVQAQAQDQNQTMVNLQVSNGQLLKNGLKEVIIEYAQERAISFLHQGKEPGTDLKKEESITPAPETDLEKDKSITAETDLKKEVAKHGTCTDFDLNQDIIIEWVYLSVPTLS